jgi:chromosome segregation ATPase
MQDKINSLTEELKFYAKNADMRQCMQRIESLREENNRKEHRITEHLELVNTLQRQLEDMATENRTLRKMSGVPDNYGIDLSQLKMDSEKKIENYTKLIKVLQDDNYKLEEERARLKHMIKQQSMLYTNNQPWNRFPDLTPDQLNKVDQFVMRMKSGDDADPADYLKLKQDYQVLKGQLEALNAKGFEFAKATIDAFMKEMGLSGGENGDTGRLFDRL